MKFFLKDKVSIYFVFFLMVSFIVHGISSFFEFFNNDLISKYSFNFAVLWSLIYLIYKTRNLVSRWMSISVNPELMPLVRLLYGVLCLYSAIQHFSLIQYGLEPYNFLIWGIKTPSFFVYVLYSIHLIAITGIILGYKLRLCWILLFFTGGAVIPFSLEIFVKNIFNFYAMFIPSHIWHGFNNEKTKKYNGWPILLMGVSYSILMSSAGLFKLVDPVWQGGMGLYYSLNIPFFLPKYLWGLLDYETLMQVLNWVTIVFELLAFPLILFKRTRLFGMITLIALGSFLSIFMEGIGVMGGPIILTACLAILSLTKYPFVLKKYLPKFLFFNIDSARINQQSFCPIWVGVFVTWWTITGFYSNIFQHAKNGFNIYPPKYGSYIVRSSPYISTNNSIFVRLQYIGSLFDTFRPPKAWEFIWTLELFDYHHLFDRIYFRIVFLDENGVSHEPVIFFDEEGAISKEQPLPGNERFLLSAFRIMEGMTTGQFKDKEKLSNNMISELKGLIYYCKGKNASNVNKFKIGKIQIKQIIQPYSYMGNYKSWKDFEWKDLYWLDFNLKEDGVNGEFEYYDYSKLSIDAFKNKVIEPNF